ncbi:MAG: COX15/CtaA family protein, partial [Actinomycetota bacterium]
MNSVSRRRITPAVFRWFALADFVAMILIIISGTAVRLTGSGLGCPDWPTCYRHRLSVPFSFHPWIEFGNRLVTASLVVVTVVVLVAALRRTPLRRDLVRLSAALVGGVVLDAVLGAIVVYAKLNPWLVCLHLVVSLAMVVLGAVLYHRSKYLY